MNLYTRACWTKGTGDNEYPVSFDVYDTDKNPGGVYSIGFCLGVDIPGVLVPRVWELYLAVAPRTRQEWLLAMKSKRLIAVCPRLGTRWHCPLRKLSQMPVAKFIDDVIGLGVDVSIRLQRDDEERKLARHLAKKEAAA